MEYRPFWLRRLHSVTGLVPVGAFVLFHLFANARALQGQLRFEALVERLQSLPGLRALEIGLVFVPLAVHAALGVQIASRARPNLGVYPFPRNWSYVLQRVTGVVVLVFLLFHVGTMRFEVARGRMRPVDFFPVLCDTLSATGAFGIPMAAAAYLTGLAAVSYHLGNGIRGFCFTWGLTPSPKSRRVAGAVGTLIGLVAFFVGARTVVYYATGGAG